MTKPTPLDKLNERQRKYVEARTSGMSVAAAGKSVGIPHPQHAITDYEQNPKIQIAIAAINAQAMKNLVVTRQDVIAGFMDAVRAAATSAELVMAWREIGKIIGAYEPEKLHITHELLVPDKLRSLSDAQLAQAAGLHKSIIDGEFYETAE